MAGEIELHRTKQEHAVILWPDTPPEPPFYDDCREAQAVAVLAGGGMVVTKVTYESDWIPHEPHA